MKGIYHKNHVFLGHIKAKNALNYIYSLFLVCMVANGQSLKDGPVVFPPSPSSASFQNYIDYPMDLYSGLPKIDIPLFNITIDNYNLPISLSYFAGGVKVQENESIVGLKWSLNSGGLISRNVSGHPDESRKLARFGGWFDDALLSDVLELSNNPALLKSTADGCYDFQPDVFYLNSPTGGVKFVFDKNQTPFLLTPNSNFIITPDNLNLQFGWTVLDESGNKYYFSIKESTENQSSCSSSIPISCPGLTSPITTWNLDYIIPVNSSKKISFKYEYYSYDETLTVSESFSPLETSPNYNRICDEKFTYNLQVPKEIVAGNYKVIFVSSQEGTNKYPKINEIKLLYKNDLIKDFVFEYSNDKLLLKSIKEVLPSSPDIYNNKYAFDYYNETFRVSKNSYAVDYFGFYNGQISNQSLIPNKTGVFNSTFYQPLESSVINFNPITNTSENIIRLVSLSTIGKKSNREINPQVLSNLSLKTITYPTGGTKAFYYEPNVFDNNVDYIDQVIQNKYLFGSKPDDSFYSFSDDFIVSDNNTDILINRINFNSFDGGTIPPAVVRTTKVEFLNVITNQVESTYSYNMRDQTPMVLRLNSGSYKLKFYFDSYCDVINVNLSYSNSFNAGRNRLGGGQRVNKIEFEDVSTNAKISKQYIYSKFDDSNLSSGILPDALFNKNTFIFKELYMGNYIDVFKSTANKAMTVSHNSLVNYSDVQVVEENSIDSTKIVYQYKYSWEPDDYKGYHVFGTPHTSHDQRRGLLLWEKHFNNGVVDLIKKIENFYTFDSSSFKTVRALATNYDNFNSGLWNGGLPANTTLFDNNSANKLLLKYEFYNYNSEWVYKNKEKITEYYSNGTLENQTEYVYSNNLHKKLSSQNTINSLNETIQQKLFYPLDLLNAGIETNKMQQLISQNRISNPLKTETYKNSMKISESYTKYEQSNLTGNLLLPKSEFSLKGGVSSQIDSSENCRMKYTLYDNDLVNGVDVGNGKILEYRKENDVPISIIWGYNKTLPIAKIENATYSQIESLVENLQNTSNNESETNLLNALNALRLNPDLANSMITTYTHIPLVGVSSITKPNGDVTTYEYDSFNRLKSVKDQQGNTVSENEYHFKP